MNHTVTISQCPVCGSGDSVFESVPLANLYSEKLAAMLEVKEEVLLEMHANHRCAVCDVCYKRNWFHKSALSHLFTEVVPDHPKGWDAVSDRYSFENFQYELGLFEKALVTGDASNANRYRRALTSILDSTPVICEHPDHLHLFDAIRDGRTDTFHEPEVVSLLEHAMVSPVPFKRFAGFTGSEFWAYLEAKTGPITDYAELGCPLWGLARMAASKGIPVTFFHRVEPNYWGESCQRNGSHCVRFLEQAFSIPVRNWSEEPYTPGHLIGFFQYLDHLNHPTAFLDEVFTCYRHAAVILDHVDEPAYIQHLTGFSSQTMAYLADRYGRRLHADFQDIRPSGNILYLFTDDKH